MRNIFLFIRRYFNFLFFLALQVFSIYLIVHYSKFHNAIFSNTANLVTGKINEQYNKVEYYFRLKQTNDSLVKANEALYNKLKADFELPDTASKKTLDAIHPDSLESFRKYTFLSAKVVSNSVAMPNNFLVLTRSTTAPIKEGMGVIAPNSAVVGIVTLVNQKYALVMSLLHKDSHISGKLLNGPETGTLSWDGKAPNYINLAGIPKSAKVARGDTIVSSGYSTSFPKGLLVGIVDEVTSDKSTSNYMIRIKTAANFYNLEFVYTIDNNQAAEINNLLEKGKKQNQ